MTIICAWCKRTILEMEDPVGVPNTISHGICLQCKEEVMAEKFDADIPAKEEKKMMLVSSDNP